MAHYSYSITASWPTWNAGGDYGRTTMRDRHAVASGARASAGAVPVDGSVEVQLK